MIGLVYSMNSDIQIFHRSNLELKANLPITINTRAREFDPSLIRAHDGQYALLWSRGTSRKNARRFVAFSADLLRWDTPQRLVFEAPQGKTQSTYSRYEPLERTYNVLPTPRAYVMLLAQGLVRHSQDLKHWGPPRQAFPQDLYRNRLEKTPDGTLWAVYENSSDELQPYTSEDRLHGYFVVGGKRYRHLTELRLRRSLDGIQWKPAGEILLPGQPSGLWAFAVSESRLGIAVVFNNLFAKWLSTSQRGGLREVNSELRVIHQSREASFFVREGSLTCVRPIFDFEEQAPRLLATDSNTLYERFLQ